LRTEPTTEKLILDIDFSGGKTSIGQRVPDERSEPPQPNYRLHWTRAICLALLGFVWLRSAWVSDDAYITFRSVEFVFEGLGARWNLAERVQVYTHPLWFLLLLGVRSLSADLFSGALILSGAITLIAAGLLLWQAKQWTSALALTGVLCSSKAFIEFSSSGLENPLCHLLFVGLYLLTLASQSSRGLPYGLLLGLLLSAIALTRIDLLLLAAPAATYIYWRAHSKTSLLKLFVGLIPLFLWELGSLFYYGDIVPNTACAKVNHVLPLSARFSHAADYFWTSLSLDPVTLPFILLIALATLIQGKGLRFISLGIILHLAYLAWIPGDFMAGRMQSTSFCLAAAMFLAYPLKKSTLLTVIAGLALGVSLMNPRGPLTPNRLITTEGSGDTVDERAFYCCERTLKELRPEPWNGETPEVLVGWGGGITYETGPSTHFVDKYALSDPLLARLPKVSTTQSHFRPGHLDRSVPEGYLLSLRTQQNQIQDEEIAALWDDVRIATRAPLLDPQRWRAIRGTMLCGRAHRHALLND
jgi:arabinofuranosyltransferase